MAERLNRTFFSRATTMVAQELLGKRLHFNNFSGIITETEAYCGLNDPASHAFRGPTPRAAIMFGEAGFSYVYLIYGMYYCLNFVTETPGIAGAVLIRGLQLDSRHLNGPGKICRHLEITKAHHNIDITQSKNFWVEAAPPLSFIATPRIGIKTAQDRLWRYLAKIS